MRLAALWTMLFPLILAVGCASTDGPEPSATIHPQFAKLRPVMVAVMVQATTGDIGELDSALRAELIERRYSPLAPGAEADDETGTLLVVVTQESAVAAFSAASGTLLYKVDTDRDLESPRALAKILLASLPPK